MGIAGGDIENYFLWIKNIDEGYGINNNESFPMVHFATGHFMLSVSGSLRLAAGGWRLAAGGWRLAAGGWRLAAGGLLWTDFSKVKSKIHFSEIFFNARISPR